jgi:ketosteroid isomerase-like protein
VQPEPADALALRGLVDRYALAVDRRDPVALVDLFADDAEIIVPPPLAGSLPSSRLRGHDEIAGIIAGVSSFRRTRHVVSQQVLDIAGETATGETYCEAHHVAARRPDVLHSDSEPERVRDLVLALRYADGFARVGGRWLFTRRELHLDWTAHNDVRWPT